MAEGEHRRQLVKLLLPLNPKRGAEIGVAGGSTSAILFRQFPDLFLYLVDPWETVPVPEDSAYWETGDPMARAPLEAKREWRLTTIQKTDFAAGRREMLVLPSLEAAKLVPDKSLDFAFVDARHDFEGALQDWQAWWEKVRPGGILSGHDYLNNGSRSTADVTPAVDQFAASLGLPINVGTGFVAWIHKP